MPITLRTLPSNEMPIIIDMAAREGWNPGLCDGGAFHAADPGGFLVAESEGHVLGCISAVSYGGAFGFIGLFIVQPAWRGQGVGRLLWDAGMDRLSGQVVGLDGVPAQQSYYRRKGFELAWQNIRYAGVSEPANDAPDARIVPFDPHTFALLDADDRSVFPAPREAFLRTWVAMPGATTLVWLAHGRLAGWGVIRPCRQGYKIGPLVADNAAIANDLYTALCQTVPLGSVIYLDVPEPNDDALRLAQTNGMHPVFNTARMYRGSAPATAMYRIYGITSFELG